MKSTCVVLAVLALRVVSGQTPDGPLSFEVASLKRASDPISTKSEYTAGYNDGMRAALAGMGLRISGRNVRVTDNSLKDLIRLAYEVKEYQISGPGWMAEDKFEIAATMPEGATRSQAPRMLQTLLEQRFHLKVKRETRQMSGYALVEDKSGARLKPSSATRGGPGIVNAGTGKVAVIAATLSAFADLLSKAVDLPVVDTTGIAGLYDFDLSYRPELSAAESDERGVLSAVLRQQFGLRMEKREMPIEILVVEADRAFTEN